MDWVKDDGGLLRRVSPFRYLRIVGYLLLPEAFRSLSRLSSALSAKASTIRSFMHDQQIRKTGCFHIDTSIALLALVLGQLFLFVFFESVNVVNITSDVLIKILIFYFLYAVFKVHIDNQKHSHREL